MLFKAYPGTDIIKVIWMIPAREMWDQFKKGNMTQNKTVVDSIYDFQYNRGFIEKREDDDLDDKTIDKIYQDMARSSQRKIVLKPE